MPLGKVLFICQHNSGRSQIAEAFLRSQYGDHFEIECAGLEPAKAVNPLVVRVMAEVGVSHMPHPRRVLSFKAAAARIQHSPSILVDLVAGGIIIGLPLSIAAYWIALPAVENYHRKIKGSRKKGEPVQQMEGHE